MAFTLVKNTTIRGGMTFTGNTLGLAQLLNTAAQGTQGSIGAFINKNTTSAFSDFPPGTTSQYTNNSSSAILNLPTGATVEYAELIWGGNCAVLNGTNLSDAILNNPISFTLPNGTTVGVVGDLTPFRQTITSGQQFYMRAANVTNHVQGAGAGTYTVGGVPGIIDPLNADTADTNFAGWTLAVIYRKLAMDLYNMALYAGGEIVNANGTSVNIGLTGFATPTFSAPQARILLSAGEGDMQIIGDQAYFAPTTITLPNNTYLLSGPNNASNNFFCSQINNDAGLIDTTGTFGTRNNISPTNLVSGARQGWDITNIDASSKMITGQTAANLLLTTVGDTYMPVAVGVQIKMAQVTLQANKQVQNPTTGNWEDEVDALVGTTLNFRVTLTNPDANLTLSNVLLKDTLPPGLSFVNGSISVTQNGITVPYPSNDLTNTGVTINTIGPAGATATNPAIVNFKAIVTNVTGVNEAQNSAIIDYSYTPAPNVPVRDEIQSDTVTINIFKPSLVITKVANPSGNILPGDPIQYSLTVVNASNIQLNNVILSDILPTSLTGTNFNQNLGSISAGGSVGPFLVNGVVKQDATGVINNQATATYTYNYNGTVVPGNSASLVTNNPIVRPSVSVIKSQSVDYVIVGNTVTYSFNITNTGQVLISNLSLTDVIPIGLNSTVQVYRDAIPTPISLTGDINVAPGVSLGAGFTLAPGASTTVYFTTTVNSQFTPSGVTNKGTFYYSYLNSTGTLVSTNKDSNTVQLNLSQYPPYDY